MKKVLLTLALVFGMLTAHAQFFVGGQFDLTYNKATQVTTFTLAPELGYAFNDTWTVAGAIGYTHDDHFNSFFLAPYARWTFFTKDFLSLLVDGGFGISVGKEKGFDSRSGFEIGLRPGLAFNITDNFSLVAHCGFLGFRDDYKYSITSTKHSVSGLSLKGNDLSFSLYYKF